MFAFRSNKVILGTLNSIHFTSSNQILVALVMVLTKTNKHEAAMVRQCHQ